MIRFEDIRRYAFPRLDSNMFLICRNGEAMAVDPHVSDAALAYLEQQGTKRVLILLTHEHYDHTSGVTWLAERFPSSVVCQRFTAESLRQGKNNRPVLLAVKAINRANAGEMKALMRALPQGYACEADVVFDGELRMMWQGTAIRLMHTPGHSPGSCCMELGGGIIATGDSLIRRTPVITRFAGGSKREFLEKTRPYLRGIREGTWILPGHGEPFRFRLSDLEADGREG
jgi:glyoxylase-like metal-dependent hydrolase (beta-lactamase superfamily II)